MTADSLVRQRFDHAALLYHGLDEFLAGTVPYLREGIAEHEPMLVVVDAMKIAALQQQLGSDADRVQFADMAQVGRNPARIIPAWQRFIDEHLHPGHPVRGIGEPIWAARSPAELVECQAHETLLNVAFGDSPGWTLLCPYDVSALPQDVVDEARRSHPTIVDQGGKISSGAYVGEHPSPARLDAPLPPPPEGVETLDFGPDPASLRRVRSGVEHFARAAGLDRATIDNLVMAASELATNSLRYGGGRGTLRMWATRDTVICEFSDSGHITGPVLLGRQMPDVEQESGRGLWLANQLCDLVQIRSGPTGTRIRLHIKNLVSW